MDSPDPELGKNPGRAGSHVPGQDAGATKNAGMPRVNTRPDNPGALVEDTQDSPDAEMQHLPVRMDGM